MEWPKAQFWGQFSSTRSFPGKLKSMGFDVKGFADDHQLWKQFYPLFQVKVLGVDINRCFEAIATWMNEFFLHLNASKTKILIVTPPSVKSSIHINGTFVNGTCIRFMDSAKNLGIVIDNELSFDVQINKVVSSCFYTIAKISKIKDYLNQEQLKTLMISLVFSKLDYCNSIYYGLNSQLLNKLQIVQNSALHVIFKMSRYDRLSTTTLCNKLHWLKIKERITFKILLIVHKCVIGTAPSEIRNFVDLLRSDRSNKVLVNLATKPFRYQVRNSGMLCLSKYVQKSQLYSSRKV